MVQFAPIDDELMHRLPLPLAQVYRRAQNAKHATDRHLNAFYLWEATLKLLASAAIVEFAQHPQPDEKLTASLRLPEGNPILCLSIDATRCTA